MAKVMGVLTLGSCPSVDTFSETWLSVFGMGKVTLPGIETVSQKKELVLSGDTPAWL